MGFQLQPQEFFTVFREIDDHTDTSRDNYYVRAVIRNARTSALIESLDLVNDSNGGYSKVWHVPADPSGLGFYIKIVTSVYTDSGYTTKSTKYGDQGDTYLIAQRPTLNYGWGGGAIDYKKIQKMVDESISKIEMPKQQKIDLSELKDAMDRVLFNVSHIEIPDQEKVDLSSVEAKLINLEKSVSNIKIPDQEKVDYEKIIKNIKESIDVVLNKLKEINDLSKIDRRIIENEIKDLKPKKKAVEKPKMKWFKNQDKEKEIRAIKIIKGLKYGR